MKLTGRELRLGNLLLTSSLGTRDYVVTVESLDEVNAFISLDSPEEDLSREHELEIKTELEPIPLTKLWLSRFGFEDYHSLSDNIISFGLNGFHINCYKGKDEFWLKYFQSPLNKPFKYVHQLQNIYFFLTSEELK